MPLAPVDGPYHYLPPPGESALEVGAVVEAPFGGRPATGIVWPGEPARAAPADKLKPLLRRYDLQPLPRSLLALIEKVAEQTLAPLGSAARLAISSPESYEPARAKLGYLLADPPPTGLRATPQRRAALDAAPRDAPIEGKDLAAIAGVSEAILRGLEKAGALTRAPIVAPAPPSPDPERAGVELSPRQALAAAALRAAVEGGEHRVLLLEGVPGAGKTEVYFEAVAEALRRGRQVLVLVPEIALTTQWLARFERRFGAPPLVWHSHLTPAKRREAWRRSAESAACVAVGARSALFLPLPELGLIVVDEEHDQSFKQGDVVLYHAREMAIERARISDAPCILASATPSVESLARAREPRLSASPFELVFLPSRHGGAAMPRVELLDLRRDKPPRGGFVAPCLLDAARETLARGEQSLLFLNRRGYAPLTICRACGHRAQCPNCTAWLVVHKLRRRLICHHCGYGAPEPEHCPECGALDELVPSGPGVERLSEEIARAFPEARIAIAASDTTRNAEQARALIEAMQAREIDILIGTQIVAKGHHFPHLALVGVIDADVGLAGGDLRAAERTFQLLYQVAGRAGREGGPGKAIVQTREPGHPVMRALASGDKDGFVAAELAERRALDLPPYGRLAALIVSGRDDARVVEHAKTLIAAAPRADEIEAFGPAPAPMPLLRGRYRERILVKAAFGVDLPTHLRAWLAGVKSRSGVKVTVDVDPHSFW